MTQTSKPLTPVQNAAIAAELGTLAEKVRSTHTALMQHTGRGKAKLREVRMDNLDAYRAALVATAGLSGRADNVDVLDIAFGNSTVIKVTARYAALDAEDATEAAPVRNRIFPADFETTVRPDGQLLVTATDDNPSIVGSMLLTEGAAKRLLDQLASALGYSVGMVNAVRCENADHGDQVHPLRDECLHPHLI